MYFYIKCRTPSNQNTVLTSRDTNQPITGKNVADADQELVHRFFSSVGLTLEGEEKHLDAVVGLSGSAPAYVSTI